MRRNVVVNCDRINKFSESTFGNVCEICSWDSVVKL